MDRLLASRAPKLFVHLPIEAIVSHLIGNLVDGGYWRLSPAGPEPVGPWTGPLADRARAAHRQIIEGLQALEALARETDAQSAGGESPAPARQPRTGSWFPLGIAAVLLACATTTTGRADLIPAPSGGPVPTISLDVELGCDEVTGGALKSPRQQGGRGELTEAGPTSTFHHDRNRVPN